MATLYYRLHCIGKDCGACNEPCEDELNLPCSPSCELLGADRSRDVKKCLEAECDAYEPGEEMIPITVELTQQEYIALLKKLKEVGVSAENVLQTFASDLVCSERSGGSDERKYAGMWFNRQQFQ